MDCPDSQEQRHLVADFFKYTSIQLLNDLTILRIAFYWQQDTFHHHLNAPGLDISECPLSRPLHPLQTEHHSDWSSPWRWLRRLWTAQQTFYKPSPPSPAKWRSGPTTWGTMNTPQMLMNRPFCLPGKQVSQLLQCSRQHIHILDILKILSGKPAFCSTIHETAHFPQCPVCITLFKFLFPLIQHCLQWRTWMCLFLSCWTSWRWWRRRSPSTTWPPTSWGSGSS